MTTPVEARDRGYLEVTDHSAEIPPYLLEQGYACPPYEYEQKSDRILGFQRLADIQGATLQNFGILTLIPEVTALNHNLWLEWVNNDHHFTPPTAEALKQLFDNRLRTSETGKLALRHAFFAPEFTESKGPSMTDLKTVEEVYQALEQQYTKRVEAGWDKRDDVEVTLNLQEFTDPLSSFSFDYPEEGENAPIFSNGTPPIGGYITVKNGGTEIEMNYLYGDNRAAMEKPKARETTHYTVSPTHTGKPPIIRQRSVDTRSRKYIYLDRKNKIVEKARLPKAMQVGRIDFSDDNLVRMAAFGYCAAQLQEFAGKEIKIEFSMGNRGVYFNQITEFRHAPELNPTSVKPLYKAAAVIKTLDDDKALARFAPDMKKPGAIVLTGALNDYDLNEVGNLIDRINNQIAKRIKKASSGKERRWWENMLFILEGSAASHRMNNALSRTNKRIIFDILPSIDTGDELEISYRQTTQTYWLKNNNLAGDGNYVKTLSHYPVTPPVEEIGLKARNIREGLKIAGLETPPAFVFTREAFLNILRHNGVLNTWAYLANAKPAQIPELFEFIRQKLTQVPPKLMDILTYTLQRNLKNANNAIYIARSSGVHEDGSSFGKTNFAGSFRSCPDLKLVKESSEIYSHEPRDLEAGILAVINSSFTDELAKFLAGINHKSERTAFLSDWVMPVLIMPQIDTQCSGNIYRYNAYAQRGDQLVITAQRGIGGAVDGNDDRPSVRIIADETDLMGENLTISVSRKNGEQRQIGINELPQYLGQGFTPDHIRALINGCITASDKQGKPQDCEFAVENGTQDIWWVQTRNLAVSPLDINH